MAATSAASVLFKFGTHAEYEAIKVKGELLNNALYFISDTGEIYKGEQNLAQGHFYSDIRQDFESDTETITRALETAGKIAINGDFFAVLDAVGEEPQNYVQTIYLFDGESWRAITKNIRANNVYFEGDITVGGKLIEADGKTLREVLESLPSITESIFKIKGSVENTSELEEKKEDAEPGDVWIDKETNTGYVFDGEDFVELDIIELDLDKYATKEELIVLDTKIGSLERLTGVSVDGKLVPIDGRVAKLESFKGVIPGLVPVYSPTVDVNDADTRVLNAKGQWVLPLDKRIGSLTYQEITYDDVTQYVDARMQDVTITWSSISEE